MPDQERTERPTSKRRREAREKGRVAKSREVSTYLVLIFGLAVLYFAGSYMVTEMALFMKTTVVEAASLRIEIADVSPLLSRTIIVMIKVLAPLLLAAFIAALVGNLIQVGFLFSLESVTPKLSKLNPISGFKRLISLRSLAEVIKFIAKLALVGVVVYTAVKKELPFITPLADQSIQGIGVYICATIFKLCFGPAGYSWPWPFWTTPTNAGNMRKVSG